MTDQKVQLISIIDELFFQLDKFKNENEELVIKNKELTDKYNTDIQNKNNEISNFSKVSSIISANKELNDCKQYIKVLESQLDKIKKTKDEPVKTVETKKEKTVETKKEKTVKTKKENTVETVETKEPVGTTETVETKEPEKTVFDIEHFEDINGYELIQYKKKYYFRDLETNEIYNILNYKPDSVIGLMSNNKIKLHTK